LICSRNVAGGAAQTAAVVAAMVTPERRTVAG
jgi:hypothetical protein